jgi:hypothetical protein
MTLKSDLEEYARGVFGTDWIRRDGRTVPDTDSNLPLKNSAIDLDAAILYADLAESTQLVRGYKDWFAAEIYKTTYTVLPGSFAPTAVPSRHMTAIE